MTRRQMLLCLQLTNGYGAQPGACPIDPLLVLTSIARETQRIGLVTTGSTTFTLARSKRLRILRSAERPRRTQGDPT